MDREQQEQELDIMYNNWRDKKEEWEQAKNNGNCSENYLEELYINYRFAWRIWLRLFNKLYPPQD